MTQQVAVKSPFAAMAGRLDMDAGAVKNLMINTLMQAKKDRNGNMQQVSEEELMVFMSIANEYKLNPLSKEVYAFNNRGAIQPIVSVDGWLKIINSHPQFDGMEFHDHLEGGQLTAVTCRIYRKDRSRHTEVTEYLSECQGISEPWKKWPARMLRHKATIQAARYAFGLSGIIDPDEADRITVAAQAELAGTVATPQPANDPMQKIVEAQTFDELKKAFAGAWRAYPEGSEERDKAQAAYEDRKADFEAIEGETQQPEPEPAPKQEQKVNELGWPVEDVTETDDDIPGI